MLLPSHPLLLLLTIVLTIVPGQLSMPTVSAMKIVTKAARFNRQFVYRLVFDDAQAALQDDCLLQQNDNVRQSRSRTVQCPMQLPAIAHWALSSPSPALPDAFVLLQPLFCFSNHSPCSWLTKIWQDSYRASSLHQACALQAQHNVFMQQE